MHVTALFIYTYVWLGTAMGIVRAVVITIVGIAVVIAMVVVAVVAIAMIIMAVDVVMAIVAV
jgi:hypothetical protein